RRARLAAGRRARLNLQAAAGQLAAAGCATQAFARPRATTERLAFAATTAAATTPPPAPSARAQLALGRPSGLTGGLGLFGRAFAGGAFQPLVFALVAELVLAGRLDRLHRRRLCSRFVFHGIHRAWGLLTGVVVVRVAFQDPGLGQGRCARLCRQAAVIRLLDLVFVRRADPLGSSAGSRRRGTPLFATTARAAPPSPAS